MGVWAALFLFKAASPVNVLVETRLIAHFLLTNYVSDDSGWTMNDPINPGALGSSLHA